MSPQVSVICTVYNESASIEGLLHTLAAQTRPADEIVIVDGGSTDGTLERLQAAAREGVLPLTALSRPGLNIAAGRNAAIAEARGEIIAVTDAGVRLEPTWLEQLVAPFASENPPDVVSGFFVADPRTTFERALGAITLPRMQEIDLTLFQPSSRSVAFRRSAWAKVGGYPEWLDYCEDLVFDMSLRDVGQRFAFAPAAVAHFRPRPNLKAFFWQYYRYARGDGKAGLFPYRHLLRYGTYLVAGPVSMVLAITTSPWWWLGVGAVLAVLLRLPYTRLVPWLRGEPLSDQLTMLGLAPVIRVTGDVAKMCGYPVGVHWRRRNRPGEPLFHRRRWITSLRSDML